MSDRPLTMARRGCARAIGRTLLAMATLVVAAGPARAGSAESPAVVSLVKLLHLVTYAPGTAPPAFTARTLDTGSLSSETLRGNVVILNFWASWCRECRPEMPALERLHREFGARGLRVVGVNARENGDVVGRYARDLQLTFPLVLDPGGHVNGLYGVVGLPTTFLVARHGRAVAFGVGPRDWAGPYGRALVEALLAEPPP